MCCALCSFCMWNLHAGWWMTASFRSNEIRNGCSTSVWCKSTGPGWLLRIFLQECDLCMTWDKLWQFMDCCISPHVSFMMSAPLLSFRSVHLASWLREAISTEVPLSTFREIMPFLFFQEESEVSLGVASFTGGSICEDFEVKDSKSCGWSTPSAWGFIASWLRDCSQLLSSTFIDRLFFSPYCVWTECTFFVTYHCFNTICCRTAIRLTRMHQHPFLKWYQWWWHLHLTCFLVSTDILWSWLLDLHFCQ